MKDKDILIKKIKNNKVLQKEMLKYNMLQWEMYMLYALSGMSIFLGFSFILIKFYILSLILILGTILINIFIISFRNKITYISKCKVKDDIFQPGISPIYEVILEEIGEKHKDIFKYKKFFNFGYKKIVGISAIVFYKISKNSNNLIDQEISISKNDIVIAVKTGSGYVYCAKEDEL